MSNLTPKKSNHAFICQLVEILESVNDSKSLNIFFRKACRFFKKRVYKRITWQFTKLGRLLGLTHTPATKPEVQPQPLSLKEGELVRVKRLSEIQRTLTSEGRCEGMAYVPRVMDRYAGMIFRVHGVVDRFYDEVRRRPLQLKNTVLLAGAHCGGSQMKSGCDRHCLIFWKEAWLERLSHQPNAGISHFGSTTESLAITPIISQIDSQTTPNKVTISDDSLVAGAHIRVKPYDEIALALDENNKTENVKFLKEHMADFCGKEFTIAKAIEIFTDERYEVGLKLNNAYVLDGVHCSGNQPDENKHCKRACLLIWHTRWLDRIG